MAMYLLTMLYTLMSICAAAPISAVTTASALTVTSSICPGNVAQETFMTIGYYSDSDCQIILNTAVYDTCPNYPAGESGCDATNIGPYNSVYAKVLGAARYNTQAVLTRDQVCPPGGAAAVIETLSSNASHCVQLQELTGNEGIAIFPNGGSGLAKRSADLATAPAAPAAAPTVSAATTAATGSVHCTGFTVSSATDTWSPSKQVSYIVNCQNSASPCAITSTLTKSQSLTSSFSLSSGSDVLGISVKTELGTAYTDTITTSVSEAFSIPVNQSGYLSLYSRAVLFHGTFTGCQNSEDQDGEILALQAGTQEYAIVLTGD